MKIFSHFFEFYKSLIDLNENIVNLIEMEKVVFKTFP
jgi:hypothetical protein